MIETTHVLGAEQLRHIRLMGASRHRLTLSAKDVAPIVQKVCRERRSGDVDVLVKLIGQSRVALARAVASEVGLLSCQLIGSGYALDEALERRLKAFANKEGSCE